MKLLFIDSSVFLNFYDFYEEDLNQLSKLVDLIKEEKIKLYLTKQVCEEIKKNRDKTVNEAYGKFVSSKNSLSMPVFCKHYDEYGDINRAQNVLKALKAKLGKKLWEDILHHKLKADQIIKALQKEAVIINSDKYMEKAMIRFRLGRPPGKKIKSIGDELNWESLLAEVLGDGEFVIISADGDYASPLTDNQLKDYLLDEWNITKPDNKVFYYKSLGTFFKEHDIKIELLHEQEKDRLVGELRNSPNYSYTHSVIGQLCKYNIFTDDQLKGLATALMFNDQVRSIIGDEDVNAFYKENILYKSELFSLENWSIIKSLILGEENDQETEIDLKNLEAKVKNELEPGKVEINEEDIAF